jgi:hypothetical protein
MNRKGPSRKSQSYLVLSKFGYRFRLSVPQDLRAIVGKTEFRYSLRMKLPAKIYHARISELCLVRESNSSRLVTWLTRYNPAQHTPILRLISAMSKYGPAGDQGL